MHLDSGFRRNDVNGIFEMASDQDVRHLAKIWRSPRLETLKDFDILDEEVYPQKSCSSSNEPTTAYFPDS